jgi:hypothetical protein
VQALQLRALIGIEHPGSITAAARFAGEAHPTAQQLLTDTDLRSHMSKRATGLDDQAGSLLPKLRGCTSCACPAYRHPSRRASGPASQVSTITVNPTITSLPLRFLAFPALPLTRNDGLKVPTKDVAGRGALCINTGPHRSCLAQKHGSHKES